MTNRFETELLVPRREDSAAGNTLTEQATVVLPTEDVASTVPTIEEVKLEAENETETVATTDIVRLYLRSIGTVALLTAAEEVDLAKRIEVGLFAAHLLHDADRTAVQPKQQAADLQCVASEGERAKRQLIEANLRLVVSIAARYTGRGLDLLDLVQEGNMGLIRAVERFDHKKGFKFSTYASWWIKRDIFISLAGAARNIALPVRVNGQLMKINRLNRELLQTLGREPSEQEMAVATELPTNKMREIINGGRIPTSLNNLIGEDGTELQDIVSDEDATDPNEIVIAANLNADIRKAMHSLTPRERFVIDCRFGLKGQAPLTLAATGQLLGVNRERARQIEVSALEKLRTSTVAESLRDYISTE